MRPGTTGPGGRDRYPPRIMNTEVLKVHDQGKLDDELERAGRVLRSGGLVAFPTETVYGIAVSANAEPSTGIRILVIMIVLLSGARVGRGAIRR